MKPLTNELSTAPDGARLLPCLLCLPLAWAFTQDHDAIPNDVRELEGLIEVGDGSELANPASGAGETEEQASSPAPQEPDVDPYFMESSGISSDTGPQVITRNVLQDRQGDFWLATWNGFMRYDGSTFTNVTNKEGLRRYRAFSLLEDRQGNIWMGTIGAGVYRYDGSTYTNFTTEDGLVDDSVLSMFQDRDGNLWFGAMGLTKYDGTTFTSFTEEDGFTRSDVNSMSQAPDGTIWIGTRGALFRYDGESFSNFTEEHGLDVQSNSYIPALIDQKGHLWLSGSSGIFHYDGESVRHVFKLPSFCLMEDSHGNIWFNGGLLGGEDPKPRTTVLNRFDPSAGLEGLLSSSKQFEVASGSVFGLTEDKDGNIWLGTGRGIARIDGDTVQYY
ncbi:MAG: ligand-binding sensor domain-containing protein [Chlamydiales bacterium]|jgi:ligand-binding sensor domain-containing protein